METCKICNKESTNTRSLYAHIRSSHKLNKIEYLTLYNELPKCKYCDKPVTTRANGHKLSTLCSDEKCLEKSQKERMTEETRKKLSKIRLVYMKANPEKTAWRTKNISYPEKLFNDNLIKLGWNKKYNIIREKSVFPYFIDFAFIDLKVAIEIDGSQHEEKERKKSDIKKDKLLKENGWRIFRVKAINLYHDVDKVFEKLKVFINNGIKVENVEIFPEILKEKEIKKRDNIKKKKERENIKQELIKKRTEEYKNIKKENGWVGRLGDQWGVSHTQVRRYINKYIEIDS